MGSGLGILPPVFGVLVDCPQVWLFANAGAWDPEMTPAGEWDQEYQDVIDNHADYQAVVDDHEDYSDLLTPYGFNAATFAAPGSGGYGFAGGVKTVLGVEVWITDVEGWDSGPTLSVQSIEPGLLVGTHVSSVLGRGRSVTVKGVLFDPSGGESIHLARQYLAAALATPPHRGWIMIDDWWLPVVMDGQVKQRQVDAQRVDFEYTLRGRDGVSPGHGVHLEAPPENTVELTSAAPTQFLNNVYGFVGDSPVVNWKPQTEASTGRLRFETLGGGPAQEMRFTSAGLSQEWDPDVWLRVDMGHRRVDVMSVVDLAVVPIASGRKNVDWAASTWLEVPPGGCTATGFFNAPGTSTMDVSWTRLA